MSPTIRHIANIILYLAAGVFVLLIATVIILNKPIPEGKTGQCAETITDSMLTVVHIDAWESIRFLRWTLGGRHYYVWDRWYNLAEIRWGDKRVLLSLNTLEGKAWESGEAIAGQDKRKLLQKAWELWCNDSFWLNPVVKIRDEGTERKCVEKDGGSTGLLVTFKSGGATPGDSYEWQFDEDGLPSHWRIWASVLPVKGVRVHSKNWVEVNGAKVALEHHLGPVTVHISDLRSGDHHSEIGLEKDPFTDF